MKGWEGSDWRERERVRVWSQFWGVLVVVSGLGLWGDELRRRKGAYLEGRKIYDLLPVV